jgi:hypothetical protein
VDDVTSRSLDKTEESSDRVRWVIIVMQVACILVFAAAWHEVPFGWTHARLRTAQAAVWYLDCSATKHPELSISEAPETQQLRHDECHFGEEITSYQVPSGSCASNYARTPQNPFCSGEIDIAKRFLGDRGFSPTQAREYLKSLEVSLVEQTITVSVPFLGITLDVNDLSVLSAMSFLLLFCLLLFNMRREKENLSMLFDSVNDQDLQPVYHVLSMTQVFTIPPARRPRHGRFSVYMQATRRWSARLLLFTPLLVECFVLWNNYVTLPTGQAVSRGLANREFDVGMSCLTLMFVFGGFCLWESMVMSHLWTIAHDRLQPPPDDSG